MEVRLIWVCLKKAWTCLNNIPINLLVPLNFFICLVVFLVLEGSCEPLKMKTNSDVSETTCSHATMSIPLAFSLAMGIHVIPFIAWSLQCSEKKSVYLRLLSTVGSAMFLFIANLIDLNFECLLPCVTCSVSTSTVNSNQMKEDCDLKLNPSIIQIYLFLYVVHFVAGVILIYKICKPAVQHENGRPCSQSEEITSNDVNTTLV